MEDESKMVNDFRVLKSSSSSSSSSSKRTRGVGMNQVPCCLVDGCRSDLSKCREYHRRHKVCELHSKTPKVTISGHHQRFCQQCSRFHSLAEFDEEKRSCRKRLDGHNRRRRKPQPEPLSINSGRFLSSYQGSRFSPFHSPNMFPIHSETDMGFYSAQSQPRKMPVQGFAAGKEISFLQSPGFTTVSHQSFVGSDSGLSQKGFSEWLHRDHSNCALSLLSSTPTGSSKEAGSSSSAAHSSLLGGLSYYTAFGMVSEPLLASDLGTQEAANNLHCQEMFRMRPDGSSSSNRGSPCANRIPP